VVLVESFDLNIWKANLDQGGRIYAPEIPVAQTSPKSDKLSSKALLGSYLRLKAKQWIPKLEIISCHTTWTPNLHYLET
jgi:hypothetical protein